MEFTSNDPKMMKWEDIDETATFQSSSETQKRSYEEAKSHYLGLFNSPNVKVLDVRISPFEFYECKIRRIVKGNSCYFVPFTQGFMYCRYCQNRVNGCVFYDLYVSMLFWHKKYESFYVWDAPDILMTVNGPREKSEMILGPKSYAEMNKLSKWYPSDYQLISREQKLLMKKMEINFQKMKSARKAEMIIEDRAISMAIDQYLSHGKFSGIMEIKFNI